MVQPQATRQRLADVVVAVTLEQLQLNDALLALLQWNVGGLPGMGCKRNNAGKAPRTPLRMRAWPSAAPIQAP